MSETTYQIILQRIEWLIDGKKIRSQKVKTVKMEEMKFLLKTYGEQCITQQKLLIDSLANKLSRWSERWEQHILKAHGGVWL